MNQKKAVIESNAVGEILRETMVLPTNNEWYLHVGEAFQNSDVPLYLRIFPDSGLPEDDIWNHHFTSVAESMCEFAINSPGDVLCATAHNREDVAVFFFHASEEEVLTVVSKAREAARNDLLPEESRDDEMEPSYDPFPSLPRLPHEKDMDEKRAMVESQAVCDALDEMMTSARDSRWLAHIDDALQTAGISAYWRASPVFDASGYRLQDKYFTHVARSMCEFAINSPVDVLCASAHNDFDFAAYYFHASEEEVLKAMATAREAMENDAG